MRHQKGFTLVELMIAVAIVAIIGMIAYPSYLEYIRETRRANATMALMSLAAQMERHYTENNAYDQGIAAVPVSPPFNPKYSPVDAVAADAEYRLLITNIGSDSYTILAQRTGVQAGDNCGDFQFTQAGIKDIINQSAGMTAGDCW
ncbi:type IV pilin protein [Aliamphritea spongicola]|uniref:type IV pilin protein n=1 Tax=Aliamphritea spongicola TaxID=707589 RepID=UPI00196A5B81|nr:type IV pilin protein [Aliamphritea spongicola]MBN3562489.1 type IV pilin protein [Aliamphritea spongicola]